MVEAQGVSQIAGQIKRLQKRRVKRYQPVKILFGRSSNDAPFHVTSSNSVMKSIYKIVPGITEFDISQGDHSNLAWKFAFSGRFDLSQRTLAKIYFWLFLFVSLRRPLTCCTKLLNANKQSYPAADNYNCCCHLPQCEHFQNRNLSSYRLHKGCSSHQRPWPPYRWYSSSWYQW